MDFTKEIMTAPSLALKTADPDMYYTRVFITNIVDMMAKSGLDHVGQEPETAENLTFTLPINAAVINEIKAHWEASETFQDVFNMTLRTMNPDSSDLSVEEQELMVTSANQLVQGQEPDQLSEMQRITTKIIATMVVGVVNQILPGLCSMEQTLIQTRLETSFVPPTDAETK